MSFKDRFLKAEGEAWKGNVNALEEVDDPNVVIHLCLHPVGVFPDFVGVDAHKQFVLGSLNALSDLKQEWSNFVEESHAAAVYYKSRANRTGQMPGAPPPDGREVTTEVIMMFKLKNGKVAECWMYGKSTAFT
jgi:predicted ester cyclase